MLIGVPKEIKSDEYRVALPPAGVEMLAQAGHEIFVEQGAGLGSGFTDDFYTNAGAEILDRSEEVWARAEMIMKVKEPVEAEWPLMRDGQVIFTYFHFAADAALTKACVDSGAIAIALPLLPSASTQNACREVILQTGRLCSLNCRLFWRA